MKKIITLVASKKLPIPGVAYSNVEASAHFTVEYDVPDVVDMPNISTDKIAELIGTLDMVQLKYAKAMLAKCLQASMEVANKTEPKSITISDTELEKLSNKLINGK